MTEMWKNTKEGAVVNLKDKREKRKYNKLNQVHTYNAEKKKQ